MAKKEAAHHGGAWKVAYADFVTAMMALFMVLWISAQDKKILIATSRYFQNPFKAALTNSAGIMPFDSNHLSKDQGEENGSTREANSVQRIELTFLTSLAKDFYRLLHLDENLQDKPIDIQVTSDGLRVTIFDRARQPLFREHSAEFTEWGAFLMQNLAWLIERNRFRVTIEGHTRGGLSFDRPAYGAWELSTDRANASRRTLTYYAVSPAQIERVSGYADTRPVPGFAADAESNQRVTLSLSLSGRSRARPASAAPAAPAAAPSPPQSDPPASP